MEIRQLILCSFLSGLTPVIVLLNAISMSAAIKSAQPWQPGIAIASLSGLDNLNNAAALSNPSEVGARIIETDGGYVLEFHNSFTRMEQTLDLELVLSRSAMPSQQALMDNHELNLGPLQWAAGMQRYELPVGIEVEHYQSLVIWCQDLNLIVGYTGLQPIP
ncbi:MAG: DM13 domain-containing protein [Leptolyngbyaceae cyanobacterium]